MMDPSAAPEPPPEPESAPSMFNTLDLALMPDEPAEAARPPVDRGKVQVCAGGAFSFNLGGMKNSAAVPSAHARVFLPAARWQGRMGGAPLRRRRGGAIGQQCGP